MAYSFKGSISFGLVYIPITLHNSIRSNDISFNMLDKKTKSRIQYKKTCVDCDGREVEQKDIVRAYQYEKDRYVIFEEDDFERLKTKKDKAITIREFVKLSEIDPLYYDKPYYVVPEAGAERAFCILRDAMQKENKVGIAKTVIGSKECLAAIRVKGGEMLLSTMYFADEVQRNPAKDVESEAGGRELDIAVTIIEGMTAKFDPRAYKDEYRDRLIDAIHKKIHGKEISPVPEEDDNKITGLFEALTKSLELQKKNDAKGKSASIAKTAKAAKPSKSKTTKAKPAIHSQKSVFPDGRAAVQV